MPSQPPIPPLLAPYVTPAAARSLCLLTSTVGVSANWVVLRFILAALKGTAADSEHGGNTSQSENGGGERRVVLVSWLRDGNWWREGGRRLGINFQSTTFIDALTTNPNNDPGLNLNDLPTLSTQILRAIPTTPPQPKPKPALLILDGLDYLLAATSPPLQTLLDTVSELQEHFQTTLLTAIADLPLTQPHTHSFSPTTTTLPTPLETTHAAFIMSVAHQARMVMSVRGLDTGVARDVSGVLRVTRGGGGGWKCEGEGEDEDVGERGGEVAEREWLYFVGGDGGVRVFERG